MVGKGVNVGNVPSLDLTDKTLPRRLGPKRVGKIRKLYNLSKEDDVRQYVIRRPLPPKEGKKPAFKAPKIQRLITPVRLQRKRHLLALKRKWGECVWLLVARVWLRYCWCSQERRLAERLQSMPSSWR